MKLSIQYKLLPVVLIGVLIISMVSVSILVNKADSDKERLVKEEIDNAQKTFKSIQQEEVKYLKSLLISMLDNEKYKDALAAGDRNALINITKEPFAKLKAEGLTHWIFYSPDILLLRVHSIDLFGEKTNTRAVASKAVKSGTWGVGLEVGSRGYAQRVAIPVMDDNNLIGYMETGVEITPFMKLMKQQTSDDYVMFGVKSGFDAKKWAATRETAGLRNNYDDMTDYVMLGSTDDYLSDQNSGCYNENQIKSASVDGDVFGYITRGDKTYVCGGFSILESEGGNKAGTIVVMRDISDLVNATEQAKQNMILLSVVISIIICMALVLALYMIVVAPLKKLTKASKELGLGNLDVEMPKINSKDEIQDLADTMVTVTDAIKFLKKAKK